VFLAVALAYLPGGCDLFTTREPESPQDTNFEFEPPTSPEVTVRNLANAFRVSAFNEYARTMTADFSFVADPSDVAQLETARPGEDVYGGWDRDVETQTAQLIATNVERTTLVLVVIGEIIQPSGARQLRYDYTLTIRHSGRDSIYKGQAWFTIRQEPSGDWLIFLWEDKTTVAGSETWGLLKGRTRIV
jgi:hypothetical protein